MTLELLRADRIGIFPWGHPDEPFERALQVEGAEPGVLCKLRQRDRLAGMAIEVLPRALHRGCRRSVFLRRAATQASAVAGGLCLGRLGAGLNLPTCRAPRRASRAQVDRR